MSAKIDVVGDVKDLLANLPENEHVFLKKRVEMLIKKLAATEEVLQKRLTSDRLDLYQKLIVSLAPTCADSMYQQRPGQSIGRMMLDLAKHLAQEGTRYTELEVRSRIEAKFNI